ncbi:hypothetical protein ACO2Q1_09160 [Brevundimonas sp. VNH65]|uniref:hypothetical protein n=1 Tax=Brevundimonas sp. VNH65 TaxID=3400917 RepID=UPI003C029938
MTKKILMAATAAAAMAFAGAASAHTLAYRTAATTNINGSPVVTGSATSGTGGAFTAYKLANESTLTAPTFAVFELVATLSGAPVSTFPSGNNFIDINLTGGTFQNALPSSSVVAPGCTVVLSSGGGAGQTTASFLISSAGGGCSFVNLDLPIAPNPGSPVSVSTTLRTELNNPIDPDSTNATAPIPTAPNTEILQVVSRGSAFNSVVNGLTTRDTAGVAGALDDTFATLTVTPVYTTFKVGAPGHTGPETATVAQLGTVEVLVDETFYRDLAKNNVLAAHVTGTTVVTTGSFSAFNGAGGSVTLGGQAAVINAAASTATNTNTPGLVAVGAAGAVVSPAAFIVGRETAQTPIQDSTYAVTGSYTLNPAFYIASEAISGSFERIGRDGTNVVVPWLNSSNVEGATGTTNIIRLGNTGTAGTGPVYVTALNSVCPAGLTCATPPVGAVQIFDGIPAGGERVISTATLSAAGALGQFGRGDVLVTIEAPANTITARRYATLPNGSVTEVANGTVASDQTGDSINNGGADVP